MTLANACTTQEAARSLGMTHRGLVYHIQTHKLPAQKMGNIYVIEETDLENFRRSRESKKEKTIQARA